MDSIAKCYQVLDLEFGVSIDRVKQAYRDLTQIWHPDLHRNKNERLQKMAEEKLKEINLAYAKLQEYFRNGGTQRSSSERTPPPRQKESENTRNHSTYATRNSRSNGIECPECQREIVPHLWRYQISNFHYLRTQHQCPLCGSVLYETGGQIKGGIKVLGLIGLIWAILIGLSMAVEWISKEFHHGASSSLPTHVASPMSAIAGENPIATNPRSKVVKPKNESLKLYRRGEFPKGTVYMIPDLEDLEGKELKNAWLRGSFIVSEENGRSLLLKPYRPKTGAAFVDLVTGAGIEGKTLIKCDISYSLPLSLRYKTFTAAADQPLELLSVSKRNGTVVAFTRIRSFLQINGTEYPR